MKLASEEKKYITLQDAAKLCSYSPEYLRLLARQGKIFSKRIGRNWYTTEEAIHDYIARQSLTIVIPKSVLTASEAGPELVGQVKIGRGAGSETTAGSPAIELISSQEKEIALAEREARNEKILEQIRTNLDKLAQAGEQRETAVEYSVPITIVPEQVTLALEKISENLKQLSSIQNLQIQQIEMQKQAVAEKIVVPPIDEAKIQQAIDKTAERTEKILEKIQQGLVQLVANRMAESATPAPQIIRVENTPQDQSEIKKSLTKISENLKQLSIIQSLQLKQIQLQQQAFDDAIIQNLERQNQLAGVDSNPTPPLAQVINQDFLSGRTDQILEKIHSAVDKLVGAQIEQGQKFEARLAETQNQTDNRISEAMGQIAESQRHLYREELAKQIPAEPVPAKPIPPPPPAQKYEAEPYKKEPHKKHESVPPPVPTARIRQQ
ncbi:MAG: helix-turn-helix domain-containing protein, partial [Patescibacteria group bacterium]